MAVKMAMVGGGPGAFIGDVHRMAARLDGEVELVAGAFSADPEASRRFGASLGLAPARAYGSWAGLIAGEALRPAGERADFISIVTPNDLHLPIATAALERGFHVLCDKPATRTLDEARQLAASVAGSGRRFALTHVYLGYPMIVEARARIRRGDLGAVRRVDVRYVQGWLADPVESAGSKQAAWRTDPQRSGPGGAVADIGVHAFTLAEFVSGLEVEQLVGDLGRVVPGRRVDDDATALLRFAGGARGVLTASQVATGEGNELTLHVYGTRGSLAWSHARPDRLVLLAPDGSRTELSAGRGAAALDGDAAALCRLPAHHPEGFIEAFANLYRAFAADVRSPDAGTRSPAPIAVALRGMAFIDAMIRSSGAGQRWVSVDESQEATDP